VSEAEYNLTHDFTDGILFFPMIGVGGVGSCVLRQLAFLAKNHESAELKLCYVAMIDKALYTVDYTGLDIDTALDALESQGQSPPTISFIADYLSGAPGNTILIDNTAANVIAEAYPLFLSRGINIATPNKKPFSGSYQLWKDIQDAAKAGNSHVLHESSVGAGMPIISTLNEFVQTGDQVTRIEGVFSGTMSYLFNAFSPLRGESAQWSAEVKKAKELGFTEPDPRDDLNGMDVARKLVILARIAGIPVESTSSFPVESLIPQELTNVKAAEEFLHQLPQFDNRMEAIKGVAERNNRVVRFAGSIDMSTQKLKVGMEMFDRSHPIALLKGSDNIISFHTKRYRAKPLIIQGAGAGGEVTAMGITGDVLKILARIC
jgi:homoserine dehydrogenase